MHLVNHSENIVEVQKLSFSYGGYEVLHDISLTVHRGDYLALVGGNGSGKTTLLKLILGLLKAPKGSIKLFGQDNTSFTDWAKIGYVPQKVTSFDANFPATVEEVVRMGRYGKRGLFHNITAEDKGKANEALERVGMRRFHRALIGDLSGGQQQRVFMARALAGEPEILFLDEPTVGVEAEVKRDFYELLQKLNTELGLTIVLITHDLESVAHEAMHVACIDHTLHYHESVDAFFTSAGQVMHPKP
jgi:zinc transport system ATP-binding protein